MSSMQLLVLMNKNLRPQEVVQGLDVCMAQPRSNVSSICKITEKKIVVRSPKKKKKKFEFSSEGNKTKRLNPLPKGLTLKVPHLDLLPELDNEDYRSNPPRQ